MPLRRPPAPVLSSTVPHTRSPTRSAALALGLAVGLAGLVGVTTPLATGFPSAAGAVAAIPDPIGGTTGSTAADDRRSARPASRLRLSNGCRLGRRGRPACGALVGAAHGANAEPTSRERFAGRPLGVRRTFWTADDLDEAVRAARGDVERGRLPWLSFKLPRSWERMAAGDGDAWARRVAQRLDEVPGPVWVAFHHEPEGDGDIRAWRAMQERLVPIVRRTTDNVGYTVILTGWNQVFGAPAYRLARVWPRGVKVDVAGFDVYNEYGVTKKGHTIKEWPRMERTYFRRFSRWAARTGVAWGLAETGLTDEAAAARPGWMRTTYRALERHDGVAFTYFDTAVNAYGSWKLSTAVKRNAFREILRASPRLRR